MPAAMPALMRADVLMPRIFSSVKTTAKKAFQRSEEHTSELQSQSNLVCRLLLEKQKATTLQSRLVFTSPHRGAWFRHHITAVCGHRPPSYFASPRAFVHFYDWVVHELLVHDLTS